MSTDINVPVLRNQRFLVIWIGQTISILGDTLYNLALMWWVVQETGSGTAMSAVALAGALPRIILGPLVGVYVDRWDRRMLMFVSNLVNGVITASIAVLLWQGGFSLSLIIISAALMGIVSTFHAPAFEAAVPTIVGEKELVRANSLMQTSHSVTGLVAPALSGVLIAFAGTGFSIMVDAITFFIAAISLLLITLPKPVANTVEQRSVLADAAEGFRYISRHGMLLPMLMFFAVINLTLAPMGIALPILIAKVMEAGPEMLGLFGSFQSAGILIASSLLSAAPGLIKRTGVAMVAAILMIGASTVVIGFAPGNWALLAGATGLGIALIIANVASQTIWQREVTDELRGRVFAARHTFSSGLRPLGLAVAGPMIDWVGARWLMGGAGIICMVTALAGWLVPGLIGYQHTAKQPDAAA